MKSAESGMVLGSPVALAGRISFRRIALVRGRGAMCTRVSNGLSGRQARDGHRASGGRGARCNCIRSRQAATLIAMFLRPRHIGRSYRAFWVALLILMLVSQPTLLATGAAHASEHLILSGQTHDTDREGAGIAANDPTAEEDGGLWHGLMHLGHCCGHGSALPSDGVPIPPLRRPGSAPVSPSRAIQSLMLPHPLRPPIQA